MLRERKLFLACRRSRLTEVKRKAFRRTSTTTTRSRHEDTQLTREIAKIENLLFCERTLGLLSPKYEAIEACLQLQQSTQ